RYRRPPNTFMMYLPRLCEHCLNPSCVATCPSGAIYKREEDGIVLIDQDKCRGWRLCISGCPYKKIYFNWKSGKSEKCIFCYPRIESGQPTVCSETCVGRIRYLGVLLYDADRIEEAASTEREVDLYERQCEVFLDPHDPSVIEEALKQGIPQNVIEAAQRSPVYKMAMDWKLALPLHPEYRTLPMVWLRERVGYHAGQHIRFAIRRQVLDRLQQAGPAWIQGKPAGSWATLVLEQIDDMHDYYARYLPQMALAVSVPLLIVVAIFPSNWAAALILLGTAPLIPLFMALVGMGAADANRRNFLALARLSGHFLDRLRGMETLRIFGRGEAEIESIRSASEDFRQRTMEVLRLAFLSSGILEFFTSLSIALVAVYFGFSYLGELDFGHYDTGVTLAAGFLALILAPEFFQPLRDLGTFYHAKAQAVGAADSLKTFMETPLAHPQRGEAELASTDPVTIEAEDLFITSP
ncbi:ABC transporter transmembrane domain-containing protein, partial [Escherichia sp. HC-CC4]